MSRARSSAGFPATSVSAAAARRNDLFATADELLAQMASMDTSDPARTRLRERLIRDTTPIAHGQAARYRRTSEPIDDLNQVAVLGLILAIDRFDASRKVAFRYFALPTITGELRRHFRDRTWSVRVTRRIQELSLAVRRRETELAQDLRRTPTEADLAADLGISTDDVRRARVGVAVYRAHSLNHPLAAKADGPHIELGDVIGDLDHDLESVPDRDALRRALPVLPPRLLTILKLRFVDGLSQQQIADRVGVSQMHVSRLIARSVALLRSHLVEEQL